MCLKSHRPDPGVDLVFLRTIFYKFDGDTVASPGQTQHEPGRI